MILAAQNERTYSVAFVRSIILTMRRSVCFLGLSLLCGAFAPVDGQRRPAQGGLLRPPDGASTDDGFSNPAVVASFHPCFGAVGYAVEEPPPTSSEPSSDFFAGEHVRDVMPQVGCCHLRTRVVSIPFSPVDDEWKTHSIAVRRV